MAKPYSTDLRKRVVAAVEQGGMSRHQAAGHFGVAISTAIAGVRRFRETGSAAPGQMGGHKPKAIRGSQRDWLMGRCKERDFTLRGLVTELAERGLQGRLPLGVGIRPRREAELQKKLSSPASRIVRTSRGGGRNGKNIRLGLILPALFSMMKLGPRPIWRRCGDGPLAASGSRPRRPSATGTP